MRAETAETQEDETKYHHHPPITKKDRATEVAKGFFWQTPGAILPYVVFLVLLLLLTKENNQTSAYRMKLIYTLLVGSGMIPSLIILVSSWKRLLYERRRHHHHHQRRGHIQSTKNNASIEKKEMIYQSATILPSSSSSSNHNDDDDDTIKVITQAPPLQQQPTTTIWSSLKDRRYLYKLIGTGFSWALYDFIYYGTAFNQPEILASVLGNDDDDDLIVSSWRNVIVGAMGIPGVICAIKMMEPMGGPKPLQSWGFVLIGIASMMVAFFYESEDNEDDDNSSGAFRKWGGFVSCCLLIFSLNWGCNVSTYVLPIEMFPKDVRSSFHGVSAGMGKLGALLGSFCFTKLNAISVSLTFSVCLLSCVMGVLITWLFIDPARQDTFFVKKEFTYIKNSDCERKQLISPMYIGVE